MLQKGPQGLIKPKSCTVNQVRNVTAQKADGSEAVAVKTDILIPAQWISKKTRLAL